MYAIRSYYVAGGSHYLYFPLQKERDHLLGRLLLTFSDDKLKQKRQAIVRQSSLALMVCTLVAAVFLITAAGFLRLV